MNPKDFFKELGLGDDDLQQAREWVSYKKFASSVPDVLKLKEYVNTVYKHAVDKDAKPHQWFSERYMKEKFLLEDIFITDEYIRKLQDRILQIGEKNPPPHIVKFLAVCIDTVQKENKALSKDCLIFMNQIYKGKL